MTPRTRKPNVTRLLTIPFSKNGASLPQRTAHMPRRRGSVRRAARNGDGDGTGTGNSNPHHKV